MKIINELYVDTEEEAAEAYDIGVVKLRGLKAMTNFDLGRYDVDKICSIPLISDLRPGKMYLKGFNGNDAFDGTIMQMDSTSSTNALNNVVSTFTQDVLGGVRYRYDYYYANPISQTMNNLQGGSGEQVHEGPDYYNATYPIFLQGANGHVGQNSTSTFMQKDNSYEDIINRGVLCADSNYATSTLIMQGESPYELGENIHCEESSCVGSTFVQGQGEKPYDEVQQAIEISYVGSTFMQGEKRYEETNGGAARDLSSWNLSDNLARASLRASGDCFPNAELAFSSQVQD